MMFQHGYPSPTGNGLYAKCMRECKISGTRQIVQLPSA